MLRCDLDAGHKKITEAEATCTGRIFFDDSGEKYLLCKNVSVDAILDDKLNVEQDCSLKVIK